MIPAPRSRYRLLLRACLLSLSASLIFPLAHTARAADGTWNTTTSGLLWSTAGNWSGTPGVIADGSGFTAYFNNVNLTASSTVHVDSIRTIGNLVFGDLDTSTAASWTLGNNNNAANILTLAGTTPTITVNALGTNSLVTISAVIAGTNGLTKNGTGTTTTGILTLSGANTYSGGTTISTGSLRAQNSSALGTGTVTVANGARLQLSGGIDIANTINLNGTSALYGNTGANTLSGTVNLQSNSTVSLNGANDNNLTFTGNLNLSANTLTVSTVGNTNAFVTINGTINGSGGITKGNAGVLTINNDQTSTYSGTTTLSLGTLAIGHDGALGTGTFTFGANDNPVTIRSSGTASRTLANALTLAGNAGTNAVYNFGSTNASFNGDLTFSNTGNIAMGSTSRKFSVNNTTEFDGAFTGTGGLTMQTGLGTLVLAGANTYTGTTTISAGTLQLGNGGTTGKLATIISGVTPTVIVNNGNLTIKRSNAVSQGVDFTGGAITGTGSFTQAGGGTTTLTAANLYSGSTTITGGKLTIASTGTINASAGVLIGAGEFNYNSSTALSAPISFTATGGKLSGSGTITPAVIVTSGNTLAPGNSPGLMTFGSSLTLDPGSTTLIEVGGNTTAGTDYDKIAVTGQITFGGTLTITAYDLGGGLYDIAQPATLDLFSFGSKTGNFSSVTVVGTALTFDSENAVWSAANVNGYDYTLALSTGDLIVSATTPIPEPSTYVALAGLGVLALAAWRRRRA